MVGNFGLWYKGTMGSRALPMARALAARGHSVSMIVPPWDDPIQSGIEQQIDGVRVVNVKLPPRVPFLWHGLLTVALLLRTLREPADVVHVFKPKAYAGLVQMAYVLLRRLRLLDVRIVLDTDDWEGKGGWNDLESFPALVKWLIAWHERWGLLHADSITVASRELESAALSIGVSQNKVYYVPNGVWSLHSRGQGASTARATSPGGGEDCATRLDNGKVTSAAKCAALLQSSPTILLYTRFFEFKLDRVIDVLLSVRKRVPEAKLLVVGEGLNGEHEDFARLVENAGLERDVLHVGWVKASDLPEWFELADVAIYPMDDTLINRAKCPMKLVDLLSNGVPVVADRVGQVPEYVEDGVSGILVPPGDATAFAQAVAELLLDSDRRKALGAEARERVLRVFDWDRLVDAVEAAYEIVSTDESG